MIKEDLKVRRKIKCCDGKNTFEGEIVSIDDTFITVIFKDGGPVEVCDFTIYTVLNPSNPMAFESIDEEKSKEKPPLGVIPKHIYERTRIQDLCRAINDHAFYKEADYNLMLKWSEELQERIKNLSQYEFKPMRLSELSKL